MNLFCKLELCTIRGKYILFTRLTDKQKNFSTETLQEKKNIAICYI